nr:hypothetical protein [Bacillus mycoides]
MKDELADVLKYSLLLANELEFDVVDILKKNPKE